MADSYKGSFLSVYTEQGEPGAAKMLKWPKDEWMIVRYHPVSGCGPFYKDGSITKKVVEDITGNKLMSLLNQNNCECGIFTVEWCDYDGWIGLMYLEPVSRVLKSQCSLTDLIAAVKDIDDNIADLHLDYVEIV